MKVDALKKTKAKEIPMTVSEFAHAHRNYIVIVADPRDDTIFVSYKDRISTGQIKTGSGANAKIIKEMMHSSNQFDSEIDRFLFAIIDIMKFKGMTAGLNTFLQFLDGALFNLSQTYRNKVATDKPSKGAVKSPLEMADLGRGDGKNEKFNS